MFAGFTLRCRVKPVGQPVPWEFAFKLHDPNIADEADTKRE